MSAPSVSVSAPLSVDIPALMQALNDLMPRSDAFPDSLHRAMHYAVFSGGKLMRPRLLLAVHMVCGAPEESRQLALRAACAIEYVHAASLVHDDLPCFDGAAERRGKPSTHVQFGEAMAVLVGDALLSRAFEIVAEVPPALGLQALRIVQLLGSTTGSSNGIIGGQSLEQQMNEKLHNGSSASLKLLPADALDRYHSMKTAALFRLAAEAGAVAAGSTHIAAWAKIGQYLGLAYQLADDLRDYHEGAASNPNAVRYQGEEVAHAKLHELLNKVRQRGAALVSDCSPVADIAGEIERWARSPGG